MLESLEENQTCIGWKVARSGEVTFCKIRKCLLLPISCFWKQSSQILQKDLYINTPPQTIISLSLKAVWNWNPTPYPSLCLPSLSAHTSPCTSQVPSISWSLGCSSWTYLLSPIFMALLYIFFYPSKAWLSSNPKSNATPSRNEAFSDLPYQHQLPHIPSALWSFLYFGTWDHAFYIYQSYVHLIFSLNRPWFSQVSSRATGMYNPRTNQTTL